MDLERRAVLQFGGVVAVGGLVAACGSSSSSSPDSTAPAASAPAASAASAPAGSAAAGLAATADVPVGGGVILADPALVITQPTAGDFKAFSSICTHQGCAVAEVAANEIVCPCHGSKFSATDGSVLAGPATQALAATPIGVQGGSIVLA